MMRALHSRFPPCWSVSGIRKCIDVLYDYYCLSISLFIYLFISSVDLGKVCMSAFTNLSALTCHNKIKYNDDTNSRL